MAITRRYAPEASGSGIPHLEAVLHRFRKLEWKRVLPVKFFGGILSIGSGMALGREGPTVQMGGAVGDAVSKWLKVPPRERLTLISAGAGAGLVRGASATGFVRASTPRSGGACTVSRRNARGSRMMSPVSLGSPFTDMTASALTN